MLFINIYKGFREWKEAQVQMQKSWLNGGQVAVYLPAHDLWYFFWGDIFLMQCFVIIFGQRLQQKKILDRLTQKYLSVRKTTL